MLWSVEDQYSKWQFPISFTENVYIVIPRPSCANSTSVGFNVHISGSVTLNYLHGIEVGISKTATTIDPTGIWSGFVVIGC